MADNRPRWSTHQSARVSKVPEVMTMPSGDTRCHLNIVNNLRYQKRNAQGVLLTVRDDHGQERPDMVDEACFIRVTAFGWQAEEMAKAKVGDIVTASGPIKQNDYLNNTTGQMVYGYEFRVEKFENVTTAVHRTDERHAKGEHGPDPQDIPPPPIDWRNEQSGTLSQRAQAMRNETSGGPTGAAAIPPPASRLGAGPVKTPVITRRPVAKPVANDDDDDSMPF